MTINIELLKIAIKSPMIAEDTFMVVGALAVALDNNFAPYVTALLPYLFPALQAYQDTQLCSTAVGLIGDISRALGEGSAQYAESFMTVLLEDLQVDMNRSVKVSILSCFGDIALAIGPAFDPYFDTTMNVLVQAGQVEPNPVSGASIFPKCMRIKRYFTA